jgi:hypothetical protein
MSEILLNCRLTVFVLTYGRKKKGSVVGNRKREMIIMDAVQNTYNIIEEQQLAKGEQR